MGRLTTHVLDTATGKPAAGMVIELRRLEGDGKHWKSLLTLTTNSDGRVDQPFLEGETMLKGTYEFRFFAGDYLKQSENAHLTDPLFLDIIPVRFGISDEGAHYHVPLLLSPFGYSTYRGS